MRARILAAFSSAADAGDEAFGAQAALVERADICTLHKFCMTVLRAHFQAAGVDPSFRLGDESAVQPLREAALADAIDACYESGDEDFLALSARMTDEEIAAAADTLYDFLLSRSDPWPWLDQAIADNRMSAEEVERSPAAAALLEEARAQLAQCERLLNAERKAAIGSPAHEAVAEQDAQIVGQLQAHSEKGYGPLQRAYPSLSFARLPSARPRRRWMTTPSAPSARRGTRSRRYYKRSFPSCSNPRQRRRRRTWRAWRPRYAACARW